MIPTTDSTESNQKALKILELKEAKRLLEQRYQTVEADIDISDLILREFKMTPSQLRNMEHVLQVKLPDSFKRVIMDYDFGDLNLGAVFFGNGNYVENYDGWLIENNTQQNEYPWWGHGERPPDLIEVAETDAFVILLGTATESICAFLRGEDWKKAEQIAQDFELFVRGAATIFCETDPIQDRKNYADKIKQAVGCISLTKFWRDIT